MTWTPEMRAEAAAFERRTVFISIDAPGTAGREMRRFVGEIVAFTPRGVFIRLLDGRGVDLPPDLSAFSWAEPGTYLLSGIPACVADPEVVSAWIHHDDGGLSRSTPPAPLADGEWDGPLKLLVAPHNDPTDHGFDPLRARALTGKSVIVGVRYLGDDNIETHRKQFYGHIRSFTDKEASIMVDDGSMLSLPPAPHGFRWARPGCYKLNSTGQEIRDPDVLARWVCHTGAGKSELRLVMPDDTEDDDESVA